MITLYRTKQRKALLLWLNSTLGLLMYFGCRAITQGAWMQMKKPAWQSMLVLNVRDLNQGQSDALSETYDLVSKKAFQPLAQLDSDPGEVMQRLGRDFGERLHRPGPARENFSGGDQTVSFTLALITP